MTSQILGNLIQPRSLGLGNSQYWERKINPDEIKKFLEANDDAKIGEGLMLLIAVCELFVHLFPVLCTCLSPGYVQRNQLSASLSEYCDSDCQQKP
jgi:hypothetical protein